VRKVGVLATDGTLATGVYERRLRRLGLRAVAFELGSDEQSQVMQAIYDPAWGVKATSAPGERVRSALVAAARQLVDRGAEVVVAACTELSVAVRALDAAAPWIDPLRVVAATMLDLAFAVPGRTDEAIDDGEWALIRRAMR
jgi:aspartate racemase